MADPHHGAAVGVAADLDVEIHFAATRHSARAVQDEHELADILLSARELVADVMAELFLVEALDVEPEATGAAQSDPSPVRPAVRSHGWLSASVHADPEADGASEEEEETPLARPSAAGFDRTPRTREAEKMLVILEEEIIWEEAAGVLRTLLSAEVARYEEFHDASRGRLAELQAAVAAEKAQGADRSREEGSDDEREAEDGLEELLEELERMVAGNIREVRLARGTLAAARRRRDAAWVHAAPAEHGAARQLQATARRRVAWGRFSRASAAAHAAGAALQPFVLGRLRRRAFLGRFSRAAGAIQRVCRGHRARLLLRVLDEEGALAAVCCEEVAGWVEGISREQHAIWREWWLSEAPRGCETLQRFARQAIAAPPAVLAPLFARQDRLLPVLVRFFRTLVRRRRFWRRAVASVVVERILTVTGPDAAMARMTRIAKAEVLQAALRRRAVHATVWARPDGRSQRTSATPELAAAWAEQDALDTAFMHWDELYVDLVRRTAAGLLQVCARRALRLKAARESLVAATEVQAHVRRSLAAREWAPQRPAAAVLQRYARANGNYRLHARKMAVVHKLQAHCRSRALAFQTRQHRGTVSRLIAHARACLSRRFYTHVLIAGDNLVWEISQVCPPPPVFPRTMRTRLVLPPVLSGHVSSFPPH
jgi:hypothetical protein